MAGITLPSHKRKHGVADLRDHSGIIGATENTVVTFDANGLPVKNSGIPISFVATGLRPMGPHDVTTGYPTPEKIGDFWWIIPPGGILDGVDYEPHDWIVYIDDSGVPADDFKKIDNTDFVTSVDGRTGAVTLSDLYAPLTATDKNCGQFWVSTDYGDDTTGDGGINKPFKTLNGALASTSAAFVEILIDESVGKTLVEPITIPASTTVAVFGTTWDMGIGGHAGIDITFISTSGAFIGNNLTINNISGTTFKECKLEGCYVQGTISAIKTIECFGTIFASTTGAKLSGYWFNGLTGAWNFHDPIKIQNNTILEESIFHLPTTLIGITPSDADLVYSKSGAPTHWDANSSGIGIGTTGRYFMMVNAGDSITPVVKYVELS